MRKRCVACWLTEAAAANCALSRCPKRFATGERLAMTPMELRAVKRRRERQRRYIAKAGIHAIEARRQLDRLRNRQQERREDIKVAYAKWRSQPHVMERDRERQRRRYWELPGERERKLAYMRQWRRRQQQREDYGYGMAD